MLTKRIRKGTRLAARSAAVRPSARRRVCASRRRRRAGFTLLELMVVVAIVLITAALAAPGIVRSMAINRAQRGMYDLGRLVRRARSEATAYGRAHVLVHVPAGNGRLELWRGLNDSCRQNPWTAIVAAGACESNTDCLDLWDASLYNAQGGATTHRIALRAPPASQLCYEPSGELWTSSSWNFLRAQQSVQLRVDRFDESVSATVPRESRSVVLPPLAAPMIEQVLP